MSSAVAAASIAAPITTDVQCESLCSVAGGAAAKDSIEMIAVHGGSVGDGSDGMMVMMMKAVTVLVVALWPHWCCKWHCNDM